MPESWIHARLETEMGGDSEAQMDFMRSIVERVGLLVVARPAPEQSFAFTQRAVVEFLAGQALAERSTSVTDLATSVQKLIGGVSSADLAYFAASTWFRHHKPSRETRLQLTKLLAAATTAESLNTALVMVNVLRSTSPAADRDIVEFRKEAAHARNRLAHAEPVATEWRKLMSDSPSP
jgi:hypothetical protein